MLRIPLLNKYPDEYYRVQENKSKKKPVRIKNSMGFKVEKVFAVAPSFYNE